MALTLQINPGYRFNENEKVTTPKLNQLGAPTVQVLDDNITVLVPDGSVTTVKIADSALTADTQGRAKMADGYVTTAKLGDVQVTGPKLAANAAAVVANARNLFLRTDATTPNSKVNITADEVLLKNASGSPLLVSTVSVTLDASLGVALNGFATGVLESASRWYYIWLISDGTNVRSVMEDAGVTFNQPAGPDLSNAAFTGYTYKALVGAVRNDGSSNFIKFFQQDRKVFVTEQIHFSGTAGTGGFFTAAVISTYVPPHAKRVRGNMGTSTSAAGSMAVCGHPDGSPAAIGVGTIGVVRGQFGNSAIAAFGTFVNAVSYEVACFVNSGVQTIYHAEANATATYTLSITGYDV